MVQIVFEERRENRTVINSQKQKGYKMYKEEIITSPPHKAISPQ